MKILLVVLVVITLGYTNSVIVTDYVWNHASLQGGKVNVMLYMKEQMDFNQLKSKNGVVVHDIEDQNERGYLVMNSLQYQQKVSQQSIIEYLKKKRLTFRSFWISNSIAVDDVSEEIIKELEKREDLRLIQSNEPFTVEIEKPSKNLFPDQLNNTQIEWNVRWIKADKVWNNGNQGQGIIAGISDTGATPAHPALINSYRGSLGGGRFDHNYNWFEPYTNLREPNDRNGHGTHCIGTVCGGVDRQIGVAPKAKWIACRGISETGSGTPEGYTKCFQFFAAPHDLNGQNPRPELRPHVTSHSYQCGRCSHDDLRSAAEALTASGVLLVVAAQNSGNRCSTVLRAPGIYETVLSVGALDRESNNIASFSSRGPVNVDGSNRLKPEISAPGVSVTSSVPPSSYASYSGTSMATPCVAGAIALLWQAVPQLSRKIPLTRKIIYDSALPVRTNDCSSPQGVPNNVYGYGVIDIEKAINAANDLFSQKRLNLKVSK